MKNSIKLCCAVMGSSFLLVSCNSANKNAEPDDAMLENTKIGSNQTEGMESLVQNSMLTSIHETSSRASVVSLSAILETSSSGEVFETVPASVTSSQEDSLAVSGTTTPKNYENTNTTTPPSFSVTRNTTLPSETQAQRTEPTTTKSSTVSTTTTATTPAKTTPENMTTTPETTAAPTTAAKLPDTLQILERCNFYRSQNDLQAFTTDPVLQSVAEIRAKELSETFSHTRPNGSKTEDLVKEYSYYYEKLEENVATSPSGEYAAQAAVDYWMDNTAYRDNILNKKLNRIGVAVWDLGDMSYFVIVLTD